MSQSSENKESVNPGSSLKSGMNQSGNQTQQQKTSAQSSGDFVSPNVKTQKPEEFQKIASDFVQIDQKMHNPEFQNMQNNELLTGKSHDILKQHSKNVGDQPQIKLLHSKL